MKQEAQTKILPDPTCCDARVAVQAASNEQGEVQHRLVCVRCGRATAWHEPRTSAAEAWRAGAVFEAESAPRSRFEPEQQEQDAAEKAAEQERQRVETYRAELMQRVQDAERDELQQRVTEAQQRTVREMEERAARIAAEQAKRTADLNQRLRSEAMRALAERLRPAAAREPGVQLTTSHPVVQE